MNAKKNGKHLVIRVGEAMPLTGSIAEINRACTDALRRRGIVIERFGRFGNALGKGTR